jgi:hypothetical protein
MLSTARGRSRRNRLALAAVLAMAAPTGRAAAWTRTSVSVAEAHIDVDASGHALLKLELGLRVSGGWLSRFELERLFGDFKLDPDKPPSLLTEDGQKLKPVAVLGEDGRLVLEFPDKHEAPRRGLHRLQVVYRGRLALSESASGGPAHASIVLPAWPVDLEAADIWVSAPADSRFEGTDDPAVDGAITHTRIERGGRTMLHWHRVLLPRTSSFIADFALGGKASTLGTSAGSAQSNASDPPTVAIALAVLISILVALKRRSVHTLARRFAARPLPLFALPTWLVVLLTPTLAVAGALTQAARPIPAIGLFATAVVLGLHRGFVPAPQAPSTSNSRLRATQQRATLLLFSATGWLDATTPLGASLLCSLYLVAGMRLALGAQPGLWLEGLLLVSPLWLNATRTALPRRQALALAQSIGFSSRQADSDAALSGAAAVPQTRDRAA